MRNLVGLEMTCFRKSKQLDMEYASGTYLDPKGEPIERLLDMNCYVCTASYFTTDDDPYPFCPNCGHIDRKRFHTREDLLEFIRGTDMTWMGSARVRAVTVQTWEGDWRVLVTRNDPMAIEASGTYKKVRAL